MTSLRRNRTLSCLDANSNHSSSESKSKLKQRSSFLSRFLSHRSSSVRTSALSLTSLDDGSSSVDPHSPTRASPTAEVAADNSSKTTVRNNSLPLEVEIVKEEEQCPSDWSETSCLDDDDDCDDVQEETTGSAAYQHYMKALAYADSELYDECLEQVSAGLLSLPPQEKLYWTLTELRAVVWGRMGMARKSLTEYQAILAHCENCEQGESNNSCADQANLLYTCGKLSVSLNQCQQAVDYYRRELEITAKTSHGHNNLAVARIYHELARVSRKGLGESEQALGYYQEALHMETTVLKALSAATASCPLCRSGHSRNQSKYCEQHAPRVQEVLQQIQDTKRSMGRIHFEQGDLDQAVRLM
jgi:tetratricopeptide (TPR) repeat protein